MTTINHYDELIKIKNAEVPHSEGFVIKKFNFSHTEITLINAEKEAERLDWVMKLDDGQYVFKTKIAALFIIFADLARKYSKQQGFEEWIFPRLQSEEAIRNFGWLDHSHLKTELIQAIPFEKNDEKLDKKWFLDPLQCPSFYRTLQKMSPLNSSSLPIKIHEWRGGWTYRNEKKERIAKGFGTCFEFSGLELVYAGLEEDVKTIRFQTLGMVLDLLSELELNFQIVVGTSCSHKKEGKSPDHEKIKIYDIPTIDIEVDCPYEKSFIEIGGADFIGTRLVNNFGIKCDSNTQLYSGCQGIGWQRLTKVFLAQKGFDLSKWPLVIREMFLNLVNK